MDLPGPPRRQSSTLDRLLTPSSPRPSATPKLAYRPTHRVSAPRSVEVPISRVELAQIHNTDLNPLRPKLRHQPQAPFIQTSSSGGGGGGGGGGGPPSSAGLPPRPAFLPPRPGQAHSQQPMMMQRQSELEGPPRKRLRPNEDVHAVAGHYNARPNVAREQRTQSPIIGLKSFNNWIKVVLIAKFGRSERDRTAPKVKVLDLGCGKGGDLQKWQKAGTDEYIGIDLAAVSVEQARERWQTLRGQSFQADFFALDCFTEQIADVFEPAHIARPFDVVSLQFCMHYAFESEEKVRIMLDNVARFLRPGGTFMGTIPDAANLLARLADLDPDQPLEFGNSVYRVKFDEQDPTPRFGHRYTFFLEDAVEEVPEYVVYFDEFVELAREYDLHLEFCADFQQVFSEERQDAHFAELLSRMKVVDSNGDTEMNMDQWEAANLYLGFAFKKGPLEGQEHGFENGGGEEQGGLNYD